MKAKYFEELSEWLNVLLSKSNKVKAFGGSNPPLFAKRFKLKYCYAEMVEWFKAHAWKACDVSASAGSNPVLCAKNN